MTTQDNKNISTILTLESLEKEYENTMILYQQAQTNYNSALNGVVTTTTTGSNVVTSNGKRYVLIRSRSFWGSEGIRQQSVSNIDKCVALCSAESKCTGATFDSRAKSCWTRSGNGKLMTSDSKKTAIVSELMSTAMTLQTLNDKLLQLLSKMNMINKTTTYRLQNTTDNTVTTTNILLETQYNTLMADRENIARNLKEYNEINTKNEDQGLYLYQNQTSYMFWTVLCFISIAVVVKFSMFPNAPFKWSKFILWTIIVSIMLILVNFLKLAYGFILFIIVSIIVLLIILKIIPTP